MKNTQCGRNVKDNKAVTHSSGYQKKPLSSLAGYGQLGVSGGSPKGPHHRPLHWLAGRKEESCWGEQGEAQPWALRGSLHCTSEKQTQWLHVF